MSQVPEADHITLRRLQRRSATLARWAKEPDRAAAMAPVHEGRDLAIAKKFGVVDETTTVEQLIDLLRTNAAIAKRFDSATKAHYADLARRSVAARRRAKQALDEAAAVEAELAEAG